MLIEPVVILVGSNSVHSLRYLKAISSRFTKVIFITNSYDGINLAPNVIPYQFNFKLSNLKASTHLAKILAQYNNSIIHIQQANSYAYHTLKAIKKAKIKCKTILTTWGSDILVLPKQNLFFKRLVCFNLATVDIITSDSLFVSAKIKELVPTVKEVHTINFGMQHFPSSLELRLKEDIILSNRLHKPLYNIDKIISGFAKLVHENPSYAHFKLVIVASGTETEKLNCLSKNLGVSKQVHFTGMLSYSELISWYKRAKLFVSIPNSDATSLSVLEAMGYGCYPILSNLPANLEWVLDNINGQICQNLDLLQIELTKAIKYLANSANYWQTAQFNYALIKQKAVFEDNMEQFFSLY